MKNIEKEERYQINKDILNSIIKNTSILKEKTHMLDITCGKSGFESLNIYGYILRIREKSKSIAMEIKKRDEHGSFIESKISLNSIKEGIDFLSLMDMSPYLYINRTREVREYKNLKIFIDDIDLLGLFVEIEFQDTLNPLELINEFKHLVGIKSDKMPLYGDIFKEKIRSDVTFKEEFERRLNEIISYED